MPAARDWRFYIFSLRTGHAVAELAVVNSLTVTSVLDSPGSFQFVIPMATKTLAAADLEMPTAVFALALGGSLMWAGPIWQLDYDVRAGTVTVAGEGWLSYMRRITLRSFRSYTGIDQAQIANGLINVMQAQALCNIRISVNNSTLHGVYRDRTYNTWEVPRFGTLIEQLAAVRNGFDFDFRPRWTAGENSSITVDFVMTYPAMGRLTDIVLELGATADITSVAVDGTQIAYTVDAVGQGTGRDIPIATVTNYAQAYAHTQLDADVRISNVADVPTLLGYAQQRLDRGQSAVTIPTVTAPVSLFGEVTVGDIVTVKASSGLLQLNDFYRVTQTVLALNGNGVDSLELSLAPLLNFSTP